MDEHEKINYVEFPARDIEAAKKFFTGHNNRNNTTTIV